VTKKQKRTPLTPRERAQRRLDLQEAQWDARQKACKNYAELLLVAWDRARAAVSAGERTGVENDASKNLATLLTTWAQEMEERVADRMRRDDAA
jgi:hypothetical protein